MNTTTKYIEVVPYNPNWSKMFEHEAELIKQALGDNCIEVHHIGSTSVEGLSAKPKIDIIAVVENLTFSNSRLEALGYQYRVAAFNLPLHSPFSKRTTNVNVNLHIYEEGNPEIELNLLFRDYLRKNDTSRDEYAALKRDLIKQESSHQKNNSIYTGYTLGKDEFIWNILKQAGFQGVCLKFCTYHKEWTLAKHFRQTYFFDKMPVIDPYTWTFNHLEHVHFVLYQGTQIIGYAHIQLWSELRVAIRIIVIDEPKRNQGFGASFLQLIEKWLKIQGHKSIHIESAPAALAFYKKHDYINMPFNDPDKYETDPTDIPIGKIL